ncbi:hypothetical protein FFWV33_07455 [Flavobacterium faecale]|uniref:Haemolysin activator HlyB C-terminal domain-containing protein n=1 Tax=Flavobacterium faecale TaxID=1355330 RepID=A0A2S1LC89_9FLAO|nr:hypothetical protein [Flavobacterium faecale]AWG21373.1 hypothetical protein FFWV33_07455 [Flavobacterium faecale]
MKQIITIYLLLFAGSYLSAQTFYLQLKSKSIKENQTIDSIFYQIKHSNLKSIQTELTRTSKIITELGYINNTFEPIKKLNDSTYSTTISLKNQIKQAYLYIGNNKSLQLLLNKTKNDTIKLSYPEVNNFLSSTLSKAEQNGYPLATVQLQNIEYKTNIISAQLLYNEGKNRTVDQIIAQSSTNNKADLLPKGHLRQLAKRFKNSIFNKNTIEQINNEIEKYRFVSQIKYPEALLLKDSTKVYLYLEKRNSNTFDGYIGFTTDQTNKLKLNGYLDVLLENTLKAGEEISIFWKSNGENQKTFRTNIDIPYIFNSNVGIKGQINIFKQDSIFQNTKTAIDVGYLLNYNSRLYLGLQFTESTDIQQLNISNLSNYKNSFFCPSYEYSKYKHTNIMFPEITIIKINTGIGKRTNFSALDTTEETKQFYINVQATHNFTLNNNNYIYLYSQSFLLNSNNYLTNELYRFGGTTSVRGFTENSLQAKAMTSLATEYRYLLSPTLYIHSILDYCLYNDPFSTTTKIEKIGGIGFGLGIQTQSGLLKLSFANGTQKNQKSSLNNTFITANYNITF